MFGWLEVYLLVKCAKRRDKQEDIYPTTHRSTILTKQRRSVIILHIPVETYRIQQRTASSSIVVSRGGRGVGHLRLHNRGGDFIGQYEICVRRCLVFWLKVLPTRSSFIVFLLPVVSTVFYVLGDVYVEHASRVCQWSSIGYTLAPALLVNCVQRTEKVTMSIYRTDTQMRSCVCLLHIPVETM